MTEQIKNSENPVLKGVITEILDDGNYGTISCGGGRTFTFDANQLDPGYEPLLKDIVEFSLIEDAPFAIRLYHRDKGLAAASGAAVDLRVKCPHCGSPIIPKAVVEDGHVTATRCPKCLATLGVMEKPPKTSIWIWLVSILCALLVGTLIYGIFTA